jgi:carbonic anhydrase
VRYVGAFVPPHVMSCGYQVTAAAMELAVPNLKVTRIVVCGHSLCGGIRALYEGVPPQAPNLIAWLERTARPGRWLARGRPDRPRPKTPS